MKETEKEVTARSGYQKDRTQEAQNVRSNMTIYQVRHTKHTPTFEQGNQTGKTRKEKKAHRRSASFMKEDDADQARIVRSPASASMNSRVIASQSQTR